jgi:type II secretion system protein J
MMRKRKTLLGGFTFIEVIVAVALFSFLSVSLYLLLRTGIFVRRKVQSQQQAAQNIYLNLEKLASEVRNVVFFKEKDSGFKGSSEDGQVFLEFYTILFDYLKNQPQVSLVRYKFNVFDKVLYKTIRIPFCEDDSCEKSFRAIENVDNFAISYFGAAGDSQATGEWDGSEKLPQGLKIELVYKDSKGRPAILTKHVFIYRYNKYGVENVGDSSDGDSGVVNEDEGVSNDEEEDPIDAE